MIQTIHTHDCPKCESVEIVRNGTDYKGDQKYYCHECQAYGTLCTSGRYTEELPLILCCKSGAAEWPV